MRYRWLPLLVACTAAIGCGLNPGPAPQPKVAEPIELIGDPESFPPGVSDGGTLVSTIDFNGQVPFIDPVPDTAKASMNFLTGKWDALQGVFRQSEPGPSTKLAIRRYNGDAFGAAGQMPARYRVEVTAWQYRFYGLDPAKDPSVLVLIPYYKDEMHYVICSASRNTAEAWVSDGYEPGKPWTTGKLWSTAFSEPLTVGKALTWTVDVDTTAQSMSIYLNGQKQSTVSSAFLSGTGHTVALGSNGNQVKFTNFRLYSL